MRNILIVVGAVALFVGYGMVANLSVLLGKDYECDKLEKMQLANDDFFYSDYEKEFCKIK